MSALEILNRKIIACHKCPRLVEYLARIAREKRRAYRECDYWAKPVPGFGDPHARLASDWLGARGARGQPHRQSFYR